MDDRNPSKAPPGLIERLLDGVGDAVFATWPDGTVFLWNRRAVELFGWAKSEAVGKNLLSLTPGPKLAAEAQEMLETLQDGQRWEGEVQFRRADGSHFPGRVSAAPAFDDEGDLEAISFLAYDRTGDLRQQEQLAEHSREVERRNAQLRSLAVAAAHNFQEPVRDVVAHTQRIKRMLAERTEPELEEAFKIVQEGAMRMRDLAQGLNKYAELGEHEIEGQPVELGAVVETVLDAVRDRLDAAEATVVVDDLPTVLGDRADLETVFEALIDNALLFRSDAPLRVEVDADQQEDMWVVSVADNGIGIEPGLHERIFRAFQRAHSYDERPGVGLGLTICRELVETSGGSIWVDSEPDAGATFYLALPAPKETSGEDGAAVRRRSPSGGSPTPAADPFADPSGDG